MKLPSISVVMVTCNVQRFLAEAIESILEQTFRDFEFIIVDFGSTDDSRSIISSYAAKDSRIKFHEITRCGLATARNAAFSLAQGRYIAVMDADDVSVPDRLAWELEFMEKHPQVAVLGGLAESINAVGKPLAFQVHDAPAEHDEIKSAMAVRCPFCHPTVLIRKQAFVLAGGYRKAFVQAEDYDLWLRIAERYKLANLKQVVLKYRIHPHQVSMRKRKQQTLCILAAQASASWRSSGNPDPLDTLEEITPATLAGLGVTEEMQQCAFASDCRDWVRNMAAAGEYAGALKATTAILQSPDWRHVEARQIAKLWLSDCRDWILNMCAAGECSVALEAALGILRSDLQCLDRQQIAEFYLTVARLYWRQKRLLSSFLAASRALMTCPDVAGRLLRLLVRRVGLA